MKYLRLVRIYTFGWLGYFMLHHTPFKRAGWWLNAWAFGAFEM